MKRLLSGAAIAAALLASPALFSVHANDPAAVPDGDAYTIDSVHSSVIFKVTHMNVSNFYGRFNDMQGTLTFDAKDPAKSSVDVEIATESIDTHSEGRDKHLKSADFFSAK